MRKYFSSRLGRLRLLAFSEGLSLLLLVFIAVPLKYAGHNPGLVRTLGPIHGLLFLLFIINTFAISVEYGWKFRTTTWKFLVASFIPFGTFYIDHKILRPLTDSTKPPSAH